MNGPPGFSRGQHRPRSRLVRNAQPPSASDRLGGPLSVALGAGCGIAALGRACVRR